MTRPAVAVVDLGTVSTRLAIPAADVRRTVVTGLGQSVHQHGSYGPQTWERARPVLEEYRQLIDDAAVPVASVAVVATSSARDATDREWFFDQVEGVLGARPRLLDGAEEGRLTFAGATQQIEPGRPTLVIDIGGGSTEYVAGPAGGSPTGLWSAEVGAGRLTDAYLHGDPPRPEELSSALSIVEAHISDVRVALGELGELLADPDHLVVGVGGTITTVAAVEIGLDPYDRSVIDGFILSRPAVEDVFRTLATEAEADRVYNPGLDAARAPFIVGGCCVLVETIRQLGIESIMVSEADLIDGVAAEVAAGGPHR